VKDASIVLADETLKFKGMSENKEYEVDIAFLKPVDATGSTYKVLPRSVQMHVMKKDKDEDQFWPRLLKDKTLEKNQVSSFAPSVRRYGELLSRGGKVTRVIRVPISPE
jgi:prostaglandin-E synthase